MANRYWVGGTATWDNLALLKWSTTSGGVGGQTVPTSADTVFFDAASGANTVTIGAGTAICSTLTMTGFTGTLAFGSNSIDLAGVGTITVYTGATTFSVTGTPLMLVTGNTANTRTISAGTPTEANSISFNISAGSGTVQASGSYKNLIFSGTYTGTLGTNNRTIYGNLTLKTGMFTSATANATIFAATSGTQTITSAALNLDFPITFSGTATYQLIDDLSVGTTTARNLTLTSGTLDLNNNKLTNFGVFSSSNSNTRSILFGTTGNITLSYNLSAGGVVWAMTTLTGFTYTGTPTINVTGNSTAGSRTIQHGTTAGGLEINAVSFNISAGSDTIIFQSTGYFKDITFSGTFTGTSTNTARTIYGNLTFKSAMTLSAGANTTTFAATSGTQLLTSAALTLDFPITINGVGTTVQLVDALIMGSSRQLTLTNGTFNSNAKNVTCGTFSAANGNTKTLNISNSTFTVLGGSSGTGFQVVGTGTTYNLTGCNIIFTTAGVTSFYATGGTPTTVTMGGTGQLIIGVASSTANIETLTNTVQPCTVSLLSNITRLVVTNFNLSGTAGNLVTFNSSVAGTARNIRKTSGTVNAYYLNIQDSTADGGAVWYANSSINGTNNTGWNVFNNSFLMVF
jgi:hypothetical protein